MTLKEQQQITAEPAAQATLPIGAGRGIDGLGVAVNSNVAAPYGHRFALSLPVAKLVNYPRMPDDPSRAIPFSLSEDSALVDGTLLPVDNGSRRSCRDRINAIPRDAESGNAAGPAL